MIVGVGINVSQDAADFGPEVAPVAISLAQALGQAPRRSQLAAEVLSALDDLYRAFPAQKADYLARYRALCVTAGRAVRVLRPGQVRTGTAEAVNEDFALLVRWDNGEQEALSSGEVSVRGLLGYG